MGADCDGCIRDVSSPLKEYLAEPTKPDKLCQVSAGANTVVHGAQDPAIHSSKPWAPQRRVLDLRMRHAGGLQNRFLIVDSTATTGHRKGLSRP